MELLIIFLTILVCTGDFVDFTSTAEPEAKRRKVETDTALSLKGTFAGP